jgi:hypothetical protein
MVLDFDAAGLLHEDRCGMPRPAASHNISFVRYRLDGNDIPASTSGYFLGRGRLLLARLGSDWDRRVMAWDTDRTNDCIIVSKTSGL